MFGTAVTRPKDCSSVPDAWGPAEADTRQGLRSGHAWGAGHAGTRSSQGLPVLGLLDLPGGAALAPGPGTASSGPADAGSGLAGSPRATMPARGRPLSLRLSGPAPGAHGAGSRPGVTWGRGGAPPPPGGRRVAPAAAGGPGPAAARAACRGPPSGPRQWNRPRTSSPGRAQARARSTPATQLHPPSRERKEVPGLHQARGSGGWEEEERVSATPTQCPAAKGAQGQRVQGLASQPPPYYCVPLASD